MSVFSLANTRPSDDAAPGGAGNCAPEAVAAEPGAPPPLSCASHAILSAASSASPTPDGGVLYCCHTAVPVTTAASTAATLSSPWMSLLRVRLDMCLTFPGCTRHPRGVVQLSVFVNQKTCAAANCANRPGAAPHLGSPTGSGAPESGGRGRGY